MALASGDIVLGIETSCDDTSVCLIQTQNQKRQILSHLSFSQIAQLEQWGGVVPEIAARNHLEKITPLLKESFEKAKITPQDVTAIGVTTSPGLLGALLTGLNAAKSLSFLFEVPIVPVNHLYAHLEAIHIDQKVSYPYLGILLSGGHSIFFWVKSSQDFTIIGSTIDDAAGEAFDKGGKQLGLGYPAGHIIDRLSQFATSIDKELFPVGLRSSRDARLSFSGLKTAMRVYLQNNSDMLEKKPADYSQKMIGSEDFYNLCDSYQNAIVRAILLKTKYAIQIIKDKYAATSFPIVVGGGVACNSGIRAGLTQKYSDVHFVTPKFCTDNGAMIANYAAMNLDLKVSYPECLELDASIRFIDKKDFN